jgi:aryl-alcohol dehydrogenase-like predicted oxidoreductase
VVTRGSVAQGLLIDKPAKVYLNYSSEEITKAASAIQSLSNHQRTASQTAIQYVLQHPAVTSAIIGIRTIEQLREAVNTINTVDLSETEMQLLQNSIPVNFYTEHR